MIVHKPPTKNKKELVTQNQIHVWKNPKILNKEVKNQIDWLANKQLWRLRSEMEADRPGNKEQALIFLAGEAEAAERENKRRDLRGRRSSRVEAEIKIH